MKTKELHARAQSIAAAARATAWTPPFMGSTLREIHNYLRSWNAGQTRSAEAITKLARRYGWETRTCLETTGEKPTAHDHNRLQSKFFAMGFKIA